jgi:hypothetical protein
MITSLDDLVRFTQQRARRQPQFVSELELGGPGLSPAKLDHLVQALPGLPTSYLECLSRFNLASTTLGCLNLAPGSGSAGADMVERLLEANDSQDALYSEDLAPRGLYAVASWEADVLCVVQETPDRVGGSVIGLDMESGPAFRFYPAAPSFPSLLLATGRMLELIDDPTYPGPQGLERFVSGLADFGLDEAQQRSWTYLVTVCGLWPGLKVI